MGEELESVRIDVVEPVAGEPWRPGDVIGRYALLTKLAVGGMAEIWLARQEGPRGFEKLVVIKKISDSLGGDPEAVEMFLDEARIAAQLNHPNIVQIYDLGEQQGAYYIAMEYLPGEHLGAVVRAGLREGAPLPISYAVRIVASAAEGLGHAHNQLGVGGQPLNIVHRDVSPQNIMVTYGGVVKVLDFGIAKAATRGSRTGGGQLKGKTSYMAPEQARGKTVDARSDVFALGIILYELVTRARLFQFDDPLAALNAITSEEPVPPASTRNPEVPQTLEPILARALARAPHARYPTARNFQAALEAWLRKADDAPGTAELASHMTRLFQQRMTERAKLVEAARTGELTPSRAQSAMRADGSNSRSIPGVDTSEAIQVELEQRRRPRRVAAVAAAAGLAVAALVTGGIALRGRSTAETPPPAPVAAPPVPSPAATTSPAPDPPPALEAPPAPAPAPTSAAPEVPVAAPAPPEVKPASPVEGKKRTAGTGRLSLNTQPWTRVYRAGKSLGDTPLLEVPLPAGRQVLKLVNEDSGISTTIEVSIEPGKLTVKKLRF